jgi:glyoxylase-like metal-dependent hydrolase (beta-lactamase superfamily II)
MRAAVQLTEEVWGIPVPTPFDVGPVNVYVIDDDPLTLIDTGPRWGDGIAVIEVALERLGRKLDDIERVIVTHQHLDHGGAVETIVRHSAADLYALEGLADWLAAYPASIEAEDWLADRLLRRHGADEDMLAATQRLQSAVRGMGHRAAVTHRLRDGDVLQFANLRLRARHLPGHSPSDTVFHDEERGILFGGDVLLGHRRSAAILSPPLDGSEIHARPRALVQYLESLTAIGEMELSVVLPGHGEPVDDHHALVGQRLAHCDEVTDQIGGLLSAAPRTALELAVAFKGEIDPGASFFVLCDVLGHLDRLIDAGSVAEDLGADGVKRFAVA